MAELVLGPILRYVGEREATVWVETSAPCEVALRGCAARTFRVAGRHYALVHVAGLEPGTARAYELTLDGERVWPPVDSPFPPPVIRTLRGGAGPLCVAFGSCRAVLGHEPPHSLPRTVDGRGRGPDALLAFATRLREQPPERWPDLLLLLGDQVYADDVPSGTRKLIERRRAFTGRVADYEEYCHLYAEAWSEPPLRWLLSTVPTAMIFDDHDVHDDWNTSAAWRRAMQARDWWDEHIVGGLASYWVYQQLGNLAPAELARDELYARVRAADDGIEALRAFARRADREPESARWSYCRQLGRTRLIVIDSRAGRVLEPGRRSMLDEAEWAWLERCLSGDVDQLLLATSLPYLLAPAVHDLEAWNEAVCDGAWGAAAAAVGERLRQAFDLEHWAAFGRSFERLAGLLEDVAAGRRGAAPASIVLLSGDIHHGYLAEVAFRRGAGARSHVYQAVSSPLRNELTRHHRLMLRAAATRAGALGGRLLARGAGRGRPPLRWRLTHQRPWFDNHIGQLEIDGRAAVVSFAVPVAESGAGAAPRLVTRLRRRLA